LIRQPVSGYGRYTHVPYNRRCQGKAMFAPPSGRIRVDASHHIYGCFSYCPRDGLTTSCASNLPTPLGWASSICACCRAVPIPTGQLLRVSKFRLLLFCHYSHTIYLDHDDTHTPFPSTVLSARCGSPLPSALAPENKKHLLDLPLTPNPISLLGLILLLPRLQLRCLTRSTFLSTLQPRPSSHIRSRKKVQDRLAAALIRKEVSDIFLSRCLLRPVCFLTSAHRVLCWCFQCGQHLKRCSRVWVR